MRILVTVPWAQRLGGAETMLQTVLAGARERGQDLEFVFFEPGPWAQELAGDGFHVEVIRTGRLREAHRWALSVVRLARVLRRRNPDLILNWAAKTQLYGSPAAVLAGMRGRVVWWQQMIPTGGWVDRCATMLPAVAIACYSQAAADAQARLAPGRRTLVIPAGAPPPGAGSATVALDLPSDRPIVGLVGRLQRWKGQDRLLRAQAVLRERGYEVHVLIVGGDAYGLEPGYAESLPRLVEQLGLAGAVTMTGQVPDAGPYIERMDILVNASDPEPFGIVLLEGMARGAAVVAVDSGGPAEFILDGETGVLAGSGEPGALADAIEPLLLSSERRQAIARAGRESYLRDFTDEAMRKRFFDEMQRVL
ncbi:MAG TPA: glycosyltransferase [Solirubrobacteraceae bacterium]|nr:glycosyltransferase [Solirubrobacteraceae bacterium]